MINVASQHGLPLLFSSHQSGLTIFKTFKCFLLFWIPATKNNTRESKCFSFWIKNHFLWKYSSPFILYGCSLPRDLLMLLPRFFPRVKIYAQTLLQNIKFEFRPKDTNFWIYCGKIFRSEFFVSQWGLVSIYLSLGYAKPCNTWALAFATCHFITQKSHNV